MPYTVNLVVFLAMLTAIAFALPKACATQTANEQAAIELHKDSIRTTYISPADQVIIDLTSEEFRKAQQHASEFLRTNREDTP